MLFKACGIRTKSDLTPEVISKVDLFGINFSPLSMRNPKLNELDNILSMIPRYKQVFVFKENSLNEIFDLILKYKPRYIQIYDATLLCLLPKNVSIILACQVKIKSDIFRINQIKGYHILLVEGAESGKNILVNSQINLSDINSPFILAGGLSEENVSEKIRIFEQCIGVDIASGIEEGNIVAPKKILRLSDLIKGIKETV